MLFWQMPQKTSSEMRTGKPLLSRRSGRKTRISGADHHFRAKRPTPHSPAETSHPAVPNGDYPLWVVQQKVHATGNLSQYLASSKPADKGHHRTRRDTTVVVSSLGFRGGNPHAIVCLSLAFFSHFCHNRSGARGPDRELIHTFHVVPFVPKRRSRLVVPRDGRPDTHGGIEMNKSQRSAFTLVELLVVIVIIAMLAGLLLPAVIRGRETARQAECTNNQHELALALQQFETAKGHLPGYIDSFGGVQNLSWVTMIIPYLGQQELWKKWRDPNVPMSDKYDPTSQNFCRVDMAVVKCPSDSTIGDVGLSYVANCGLPDGLQVDSNPAIDFQLHLAAGLFFNRLSAPGASPAISVRTDRIPDGAGNTLLLSENIQATTWAPTLGGSPPQWPAPWEAHVGMVWGVPAWGTNNPVNWDLEYTGAPDIAHTRPSSQHPGGVVVTYADGHQQFLSQDETDAETYKRLLAPHDEPLEKHVPPLIP